MPDADTCERIAAALGVEPDVVLVQAGHQRAGERRIDQLQAELAALLSEDVQVNQQLSRLSMRSEALEAEIGEKQREILRFQSRRTDDLPDLTRQIVELLDHYPMNDAMRQEIQRQIIDILAKLSPPEADGQSYVRDAGRA